MPSRSAVPGATISSALTSRGSWRLSSSVSSSPQRVRHQVPILAASRFPASRFIRLMTRCSGGADAARVRGPPSAARSAARSVGRRAGESDAAQPELLGLLAAALVVGDGAQLAGQPDLAEARERRGSARRRARRGRRSRRRARRRGRRPARRSARRRRRSRTRRREPDPDAAHGAPSTASTSASRLRSMPVQTRRGGTSSDWARRAPGPRRAAAASPPSPRARRCPGALRRLADEPRAGVEHLDEAAVAHLEDADVVRRAEAVLQRAQRPVRALALALELQHAVDEVLEHPRAGERALLRDVPDEQDGGPAALGDVA